MGITHTGVIFGGKKSKYDLPYLKYSKELNFRGNLNVLNLSELTQTVEEAKRQKSTTLNS